ncbi:hypothetical protein MMC13_002755 [Lambiella insularis]|nr:hypothetical protein [Lambiella insularis]
MTPPSPDPAAPPSIPLTTLHLIHLPPDLAIHIALCCELKNATWLRRQLLEGNPAFEYALLDASVILSPTHLHAAIFRAVNDQRAGRMKSRNVHSEIVFALSPNNNIADSFRRFGLTERTSSLLIVKLTRGTEGLAEEAACAEAVGRHLSANVEGRWERFGEDSCSKWADVGRVRGVYKLGVGGEGGRGKGRGKEVGGEDRGGEGNGNGDGDEGGKGDEERREMEMAILGLMALRGAA